ncbi:hypothetical protein C8Q76DRAFT_694496 [Earliella scabrosa]|nr:hypothetical protein C8Q76DRAFT_694496 [Earliella scabrosa]
MDMPTLMRWRATCRTTYTECKASIDRDIGRILRPFFPDFEPLLDLMTEHRAVVGGVAALSLVLRDPSVTCDVLQMYAGCYMYRYLIEKLSSSSVLSRQIVVREATEVPSQISVERDIAAATTFVLKTGKFFVVYKSGVISACSTLSRSPSTAHMTFFTQHTFACAYPALTLARRAILSDMRLETKCETDAAVNSALTRAGFEFDVDPRRWPEYNIPIHGGIPPMSYACLRDLYLCPVQGRYFGDRGSLVGFFDPLSPMIPHLRALHVPPFGAMVAWRLLTTFDCAASCDITDRVLHEWLVSTPILVLPNPYPARTTQTATRKVKNHVNTAILRRSRSLTR